MFIAFDVLQVGRHDVTGNRCLAEVVHADVVVDDGAQAAPGVQMVLACGETLRHPEPPVGKDL